MSAGTAAEAVPLQVRVAFAHAAVQWLADAHGLRVLHVKGAALAPSLGAGRYYSDADVLVAPGDLAQMMRVLPQHGWNLINTFVYGSSFEHSATYTHPDFGLLDLHRRFPGLGPTPDAAFDQLWAEHATAPIGGADCTVPSDAAQATVLLVHAARAGIGDLKAAEDVRRAWSECTEEERADVLVWVDRLKAHLAFSVITGTLDQHRSDPEYHLWRIAAEGGTRVQEWRARVRAAQGAKAKLATAARSVLVNVEHLELVRGRPVTRREIVTEFFARPLRGVKELGGIGRRRSLGRRP